MISFRRTILLIILALGLHVIGAVPLAAEPKSSISEASARAQALFNAGNYGEAIPFAQRALALSEAKYSPNHAEVIQAAHNLAMMYRFNGQGAEAETLFRRVLAAREKTLGREHADTARAVLNVAEALREQGKYGEAEATFRKAIGMLEQALGPNDPDIGAAAGGLASLYQTQGRYDQAEPLREREVAIDERATPLDERALAISLSNLALIYVERNRFEDAEKNYTRSIALIEKSLGPAHPELAAILNAQAGLYFTKGDYTKAVKAATRALAIEEKALGTGHPSIAKTLSNLGALYQELDRPEDAERTLKRALAIFDGPKGVRQSELAASLNSLALFYHRQARKNEAEPLYRRALSIQESVYGVNAPKVAATLNNLASLYKDAGRLKEANALYKRALEISEKALGPNHLNVATIAHNIATVYEADAQYDKAEQYEKRALTIREAVLGSNHPDVANSVRALGSIYTQMERYDDAEPLLLRGLAILEQSPPSDSPQLIYPLGTLAGFYRESGRLTQAIEMRRRELGIVEKAYGHDHPKRASALTGIGVIYYDQKEWSQAYQTLAAAAEIAQRNERRELRSFKGAGAAKPLLKAISDREIYHLIVSAGYHLADADPSRAQELRASLFLAAQRGLVSEAARALAQMANRNIAGRAETGQKLREREDLATEWRVLDKKLIEARARSTADRNVREEMAIFSRQQAINSRIAAIDAALERDDPGFAGLDGQEPLTIEEVQTWLQDGEVLVLPFSTIESGEKPGETFIWAVSKTGAVWKRTSLGLVGVAKYVNALRCGVDYTAWQKPLCTELLNVTYTPEDAALGKPLPFDLPRAHALYQGLFGEIDEFIGDKRLLVVPSFVLARFPLHALVTRKTDQTGPEAYRQAAWFGKRNALSVLPAVSSIKALRRNAKASRAQYPYLGVGNPLLDGPDARYASLAQQTREKQSCSPTARSRVAQAAVERRAAPMVSSAALSDPATLRTIFSPLPETADELCYVAQGLGVLASDVLLGSAASEGRIKAMSKSGALARYRIVHFATHGALGGQVSGDTEPGLVLTPPTKATEEDDGYLSASEIAKLKLDADWVILSACNTASGSQVLLELLTGMAQAFFYAGARSLLVSNWEVDSDATVKLVTKALTVMAADKTASKADALRQAMVSLIDSGDLRQAHPALWAPFMIVGEGGR